MNALTKYKKDINAIVAKEPTYVTSADDVAKAADCIYALSQVKDELEAQYKQEIEALIGEIEQRYSEIKEHVEAHIGELRGKVNNYATKQIRSGNTIDKTVAGSIAKATFIADVEVTVADAGAVLQAVAQGKYPQSFVKVQTSEIKKYIKATKQPVDGVTTEDSVYFRVTKA